MKSLPWEQALKEKGLVEYLRKFSPIHQAKLDEKEIKIVKDILNVDWGEPHHILGGLDGHDYTLKLIEKDKTYRTWCVIPCEWTELPPLIDLVIDKAKPEPLHSYVVHGKCKISGKEPEI